jgi:hypothetical protein
MEGIKDFIIDAFDLMYFEISPASILRFIGVLLWILKELIFFLFKNPTARFYTVNILTGIFTAVLSFITTDKFEYGSFFKDAIADLVQYKAIEEDAKDRKVIDQFHWILIKKFVVLRGGYIFLIIFLNVLKFAFLGDWIQADMVFWKGT